MASTPRLAYPPPTLPRLRRLAPTLAIALLLPASLSACPWHKSWLLFGAWAPVINPELAASGWPVSVPPELAGTGTATAVPVEGDPAAVGRWLPPRSWPVIAIHAAMLPTGEVLHYSYPAAGPGSDAQTWDPATGVFTPTAVSTDIFCSGLSLLPDGSLYATGGNDYSCDFEGRTVTHAYDPSLREWTALGDMVTGRWYPTNLALGDGRVLILSGLDQTCDLTPVMERYTPGQGLEEIPEAMRYVELYPRLHLLPDGLVAHVGPESDTFTFDPVARSWQQVATTVTGSRYDGTSFGVPGSPWEVMICGGSGAAVTDSCERIDFSTASPQWRLTGAMTFARSHANAVILPDRRVLIVGGGQTDLYGDPILNAELYDPATETWTLLPAQVYPRMYHSTAVLLPDGRVLSAGQDSGPSEEWGEIYEPPYLFAGTRPAIAAAPLTISYGSSLTVDSPQAGTIASAALIAPSTVTHSVNNGQRYVELPITGVAGSQLTLAAPPNGNWAPPGFYMLFLIDVAGVPSEAAFVQLGPASAVFIDGFESGDTAAWSVTVP